jgi:hypothetical protein
MQRVHASWRAATTVAMVVLSTVPALAAEVTFRVALTQPLNAEPATMAVGDLNNDHALDVVVVNVLKRTISVFLGSAADGLISIGDFPAGGTGHGIVIVDLDGDTIPDIILSEEESERLWFLHGNGDGSVSDPVRINSGHDPLGLAVGDLDGDGVVDLAVALSDEAGGRISLLHGHADATFDAPQVIDLDRGSTAVIIADFNGDKANDIAVSSNDPGTVAILLNQGHGSFANPVRYPVSAGTGPLQLGDVDEDGFMDLVAGNTGDDTVGVLRGRADGSFETAALFPTGGSVLDDLALADVNGDSHLDVVTANRRAQGVSVLLGVGDGTFDLPRGFISDVSPVAVAAFDLTGDGVPDLLSANAGPGGGDFPSFAVLPGDGHGNFAAIEQLPAPRASAAMAIGDFDEDALADAVVSSPEKNGVTFFFGASGQPRPSEFIATDSTPGALAAADFDGDDHLDLVTANTTPDLSILFGTGGGFGAPGHLALGAVASALAVGDFDLDGDPDLVVTEPGTPPQLAVIRNNGGRTFVPLSPIQLSGRPSALVVGDFDGDGRPDIAVGDLSNGRVSLFGGTGNNLFVARQPIELGASPGALVVTDIDVDGDDDLVVLTSGQSGLRVLTNDGTGHFTVGSPRGVGALPSALIARDLNGDGAPDLLIADQTGDSVTVLVNAGHGFLQTGPEPLAAVRPSTIGSGDFDGDGRPDCFVAGVTACRLTNSTLQPSVRRGDGNGDGRINAADLVALVRELGDGDGVRADDVRRGTYAGAPGVDADGDGVITRRDARAIIARLVNRVVTPDGASASQ